jgi:NhaP-type Na+/H+ and K+/H+ antiporter
MSTTDNTQLLTAEPTPVELGEELVEVTGGGVRVLEVGLFLFLGLLLCPPLLILAVMVAVPAIAISAVVAAIAVPTLLVRRVVLHHREHGTTLVLHRILRR